MNARGIPTAAYQVLHLLSEVGYPPPARSDGGSTQGGVPLPAGVPPARSDRDVTQGRVPPWPGLTGSTQGGVPLPARSDRGVIKGGVLPWPGLTGGTRGGVPPGSGTPQLDLAGVPPPPAGVN